MKRKRHSSEEIIRKLREAEQQIAGGESTAQVCQKPEISQQTVGRWRQQFRGMEDDQIKAVAPGTNEFEGSSPAVPPRIGFAIPVLLALRS